MCGGGIREIEHLLYRDFERAVRDPFHYVVCAASIFLRRGDEMRHVRAREKHRARFRKFHRLEIFHEPRRVAVEHAQAAPAQGVERTVQGVLADRIEHHIDAASAGQPARFLAEVLPCIVDDFIGTAFARNRGLGIAAGIGAAAGYDAHYLRSNDTQRHFLNQDITDTLGITSYSQDALANSEQFASRAAFVGQRDQAIREYEIKANSGLGNYQFSTSMMDLMNSGKLEDASKSMQARVDSLRNPITEGGDLSTRNTQRLSDLKQALEEQKRLEQDIAEKRAQGLREKLSYEKYATSELEQQLNITRQQASIAKRQAEGSQEAWAEMTTGQRARADKAVAEVQATGSTDRSNWKYLDMVAPELGAMARRNFAKANGFDNSAIGRLRIAGVTEAEGRAAAAAGMVAAGHTAVAKAAADIDAADADLNSKVVENRKALAEVLRMIIEDTKANMRREMDEKDRKSTRLNSSHTDISRMPSSA